MFSLGHPTRLADLSEVPETFIICAVYTTRPKHLTQGSEKMFLLGTHVIAFRPGEDGEEAHSHAQ